MNKPVKPQAGTKSETSRKPQAEKKSPAAKSPQAQMWHESPSPAILLTGEARNKADAELRKQAEPLDADARRSLAKIYAHWAWSIRRAVSGQRKQGAGPEAFAERLKSIRRRRPVPDSEAGS